MGISHHCRRNIFVASGAAPMTLGQHLKKMMETMEKRAEMEGAIQKEKLGKEADMEKLHLELEHAREMAKIEVHKMCLEIECEKLALQQERIRAEAAAFGRPSVASGDGGQPAEDQNQQEGSFDEHMYEFDD